MTMVQQIHKIMADMKSIVLANIAFIISLYLWVSLVEDHCGEIGKIIKEIRRVKE